MNNRCEDDCICTDNQGYNQAFIERWDVLIALLPKPVSRFCAMIDCQVLKHQAQKSAKELTSRWGWTIENMPTGYQIIFAAEVLFPIEQDAMEEALEDKNDN